MITSRLNGHFFLAFCLTLLVLLLFKVKFSGHRLVDTSRIDLGFGKSSVNYITDDSLLPEIHPYSCVRCWLHETPRYNLNWTMCVKQPDEYISRQILNTGHWDVPAEKLLLDMIKNYPKAMFLDIGSNMGAFSTMIAATGMRVVAVDPSAANLQYIRTSAKLFGTQNNVQVVQNAVSDEKIELYPWVQDPKNEGYIVFLSEEVAKQKPKHQVGTPVTSVKFSEILETIPEYTIVLKIDVEGAECKVLTQYLNSDDQKKFIPFIYMEWSHIRSNNFGLCPDILSLIKGFKKSGYYPAAGPFPDLKKLNEEKQAEWWDVLWVHRDAIVN